MRARTRTENDDASELPHTYTRVEAEGECSPRMPGEAISARKTSKPGPALIRQPGGRGALLAGEVCGNRGGPPPKLAEKLAATVVPAHGGGRLLPKGQPGHTGGGGRPSNEFRHWAAAELNSVECRAQLEKVLRNSEHPAFSSVLGKLLPYAFGNPMAQDTNPDQRPSVSIDI